MLKYVSELSCRPSAFFSVSGAAIESEELAYREYVETFIKKNSWNPDLAVVFAGAIKFTQYSWLKRQVVKYLTSSINSKGKFYYQLTFSEKPSDTSRDYEFTDWENVEEFAEVFGRLVRSKHSLHETFHSHSSM